MRGAANISISSFNNDSSCSVPFIFMKVRGVFVDYDGNTSRGEQRNPMGTCIPEKYGLYILTARLDIDIGEMGNRLKCHQVITI